MNDVKTNSLKCMKLQYLSVVVVTLNVCPRAALTYPYRDWHLIFLVQYIDIVSVY